MFRSPTTSYRRSLGRPFARNTVAGRSSQSVCAEADGRIGVALGGESYLILEGMRRALSTNRSIRLLGVARDHRSLRALIEEKNPSVVVMDVLRPRSNTNESVDLTGWLRRSRPDTGVVMISQGTEPHQLLHALDYGNERLAYLSVERVASNNQLVSTIKEVAKGGSVIDPSLVTDLLRVEATEHRLSELSARERQVLARIAEGKSNAGIARSLTLTTGAVEKHINSIFLKLELLDEKSVSRRVKAALIYLGL